jgi:hypothetical protein
MRGRDRESTDWCLAGFALLPSRKHSTWVPASVVAVSQTQDLFHLARHSAVARMVQECKGLSGDGVVGVRLTVKSFYGNGLEFIAVGTAVWADGPSRPGAVHRPEGSA